MAKAVKAVNAAVNAAANAAANAAVVRASVALGVKGASVAAALVEEER